MLQLLRPVQQGCKKSLHIPHKFVTTNNFSETILNIRIVPETYFAFNFRSHYLIKTIIPEEEKINTI